MNTKQLNKESLRPIGTEFWYEFPVSIQEACGKQNRILYRIIAHDELAHNGNQNSLEWGERLDPIAVQSRRINGIKFVQLSDRMVHDYTFEEWGEIEWREGEMPQAGGQNGHKAATESVQ